MAVVAITLLIILRNILILPCTANSLLDRKTKQCITLSIPYLFTVITIILDNIITTLTFYYY